MLFMLKPHQARQLAAVAFAAHPGVDRPAISAVQLRYAIPNKIDAILTATATDSYVLARRVIKLTDTEFVEESEEPASARNSSNPPGQILVEAKAWKEALKGAAAEAKFGEVSLEIDSRRSFLVVASTVGSYERKLRCIQTEYSFPDCDKLLPELWFEETDGKLPNLNPKKLTQLANCISTTPSEREVKPWRIRASVSDSSASLKPWGFLIQDASDDLTCLIMPVRI